MGFSNTDEYFTKLNYLISNIESNLKKCSKKFKDKHEIDVLYADLTGFLLQENVNDTRLQDELVFIERELRRTSNYNEISRKKLNDLKEKIKYLNTELRSIKTMLEKSSNYWSKFTESFEYLSKWLQEQEKITDLSKTDLNNYQRNHKLHIQLNESGSFLLQISDPTTCSKLKEKLIYLNKQWKTYQDRFKDTQYDQLLKYYECEQSLFMITERLNKIDSLAQRQFKCNLNSISKYLEDLQRAFNDLECLDSNLSLLKKLVTRLAGVNMDQTIQIDHLNEQVKSSEFKLDSLKRVIPECVSNLNKTSTQITSIEDGMHQVEYWIIEGENLLKLEPDQLNFEQIVKHVEKERKHFNEFNYHENSIQNRIKQLQSLKTLANLNIDYTDLTLKLNKVNELLQSLNLKRLKWEEQVNTQQNLWRTFHLKTKHLEEWISNAQLIVSEKNEDFNFLINKHKAFFDFVDGELLNGFLRAGQKLIHIKNENEKLEIKTLMDTLDGQWKMILSHAPIRLLKLQFKRLESLLRDEIKAADTEISEECLALNENKDINEILRRHEAKFKHSNFFTTCESYLNALKICSKELAEKKVEDKANLDDALDHLENYWNNLTQKIETMNAKLTILPDARENFERNFTQLNNWLNDLDINANSLLNNSLTSLNEYKQILDKCKIFLNEINLKKDQFNLIQSQFEYLSTQNILNEQTKTNLVELKFRFQRILNSIDKMDNRNKYIERMLNVGGDLDEMGNRIRNLCSTSSRRFMSEEDDRSIQTAVNEQKSIIDQIKQSEQDIERIRQDVLISSSMDISQVPVAVQEKISSTKELIKQSLNDELERRSSLIEIKKVNEQKQNKFGCLYENLDQLRKLLETKNPADGGYSGVGGGGGGTPSSRRSEKRVSFNRTLEDELANSRNQSNADILTESMNFSLNHNEYDKYLKILSKSKELIQTSRRQLSDMIQQDLLNRSHQSGSLSSRCQDLPELKEIELRLDDYERQVDKQIDLFEVNLAKQAKIEKKLDKIKKALNDLVSKFETDDDLTTLTHRTVKNAQLNETIELIELEHDKTKLYLEQINKIKKELNAFTFEKADLLKMDSINLNQSKTGSLNEGFNETIYELDIKKDSELNSKLNRLSNDLIKIEDNCVLRLNELKYKLEQFNLSKKQKKLNLLKDTLDLELDNLVNLKYFKDSCCNENLLVESENILLDRVQLDNDEEQQIDLNQSVIGMNRSFREEKRVSSFEKLTTTTTTSTASTMVSPKPRVNRHNDCYLSSSKSRSEGHLDQVNEIYSSMGKIREHSSEYRSSLDGSMGVIGTIGSKQRDYTKYTTKSYDEQILERLVDEASLETSGRKIEEESDEERIEHITVDYLVQEVDGKLVTKSDDQLGLLIEIKREELDLMEIERQREERELAMKKERIERQMAERERAERERLEKLREREEIERVERLEREKLERELKEKERLEMERLERLERERVEREQREKEQRQERERLERLERERLERELREKERQENERLEKERSERERLERELRERERIEKERAEKERIEREYLERERAERERMEKERLDRERKERERLERELREREKMDRERAERERLERERAELERKERERIERERLEIERMERERLEREIERERLEKEKLSREIERIAREKEQAREILEKERLERERLEKEMLERIEREKQERERFERERLEWERAEIERIERERKELERIERERRELERVERERAAERERKEKERIERERAEMKRIEFEMIERERDKERAERERLQMEMLEQQKQLEWERAEIEKIERERVELKRIEFEREKAERERREFERQEFERIQWERCEYERAEKERLEKEMIERLERERREWERAEKEREREKVERERAERERIERERLEWERVELERIERERRELERVEREKAHERERIERERIEREKERIQMEKLALDAKLRQICEGYNLLKEKILILSPRNPTESVNSDDETKCLLKAYEKELKYLDSEVNTLLLDNQARSSQLHHSSSANVVSSLLNQMDQATQTQFDLIRSFSTYLNTQLDKKFHEFQSKLIIKTKLVESELNLNKYIDLAIKFYNNLDPSSQSNEHNYIESIEDIENRIDSIKSIEESIQNCLRQLNELNSSDLLKQNEKSNANRFEIETSILQPLSVHCLNLRKLSQEWKQFNVDLNELKSYLFNDLQLLTIGLGNENNLESYERMIETLSSSSNLDAELRHYSMKREKLIKKLAESDELFSRGSVLFDVARKSMAGLFISPNASKDFNELKDFINESCRLLDEKCALFSFILSQQAKLKELEINLVCLNEDLERLESERAATAAAAATQMPIGTNDSNQICLIYKNKMQKLSDLKRKLKLIVDDKQELAELTINEFNMADFRTNKQNSQNLTNLALILSRKFNYELKQSLEKSISEFSSRLSSIEAGYQDEMMKNLPSRSALNELVDWLRVRIELVESLYDRIDSDEFTSLNHLESYKKSLNDINDEMKQTQESSLVFIRNSIENEIKQGFYDLAVSDQLAKTERDWNRLKQKISNDLERLHISTLRLNDFERSLRQIQTWIQVQTQAEVDNILPSTTTGAAATSANTTNSNTKTKTQLNEDPKSSLNTIDEDKRVLGQITNYKIQIKQLESIIEQEKDQLKASVSAGAADTSNHSAKIGQIVQNHMIKYLDEVKSNLKRMELISKLKIESNLTQLKQKFTLEITDLNSCLENEINFIKSGRIGSLKQYEKSINKIKDYLSRLSQNRVRMETILKKFEIELKSIDSACKSNQQSVVTVSQANSPNGHHHHQMIEVLSLAKTKIDSYDTNGLLETNNLKQSNILINLINSDLEKTAKQIVSQAETTILSLWSKYDHLFNHLQNQLVETSRSIQTNFESIDKLIISNSTNHQTSNLVEQIFKEMNENRRLYENFNELSKYLIGSFSQNENTRVLLEQNKSNINNQFEKLSIMAERLKDCIDKSNREHQSYLKLVDMTNELINQANKLLKNMSHVTNGSISLSTASPNTSMNTESIKQLAIDLEQCEIKLKETIEKFKQLNINDSERIEAIYNLTNPCTELLRRMHDSRLGLLDCAKEHSNLLNAKLRDIEIFAETYLTRRNEQLNIQPEYQHQTHPNDNRYVLSGKELTKLINCIKYMVNNDLDLSKCEKILDELSIDMSCDDSLLNRIRTQKDLIAKHRKQISLLVLPNGLFDNLIKLRELNDKLNAELEPYLESNLNKLDCFKSLHKQFAKLSADIEKDFINLDQNGLSLVEFGLFKRNCLDLYENFYEKLIKDLESFDETLANYMESLSSIDLALKDIETKLTRNKNFLYEIKQTNSLLNEFVAANKKSASANNFEFENLEAKLIYLKNLKQNLLQLKPNVDLVQDLADELKRRNPNQQVGTSSSSKIAPIRLNEETTRIKYLDLTCRIDKEIKGLEFEFSNWKLILKKSKKLLDLIKCLNTQLAGITMSSHRNNKIRSKSNPSASNGLLSQSILTSRNRSKSPLKSQHESRPIENDDDETALFENDFDLTTHLINENLIDPPPANNSGLNKIEFKNDRTLNEQLELLKYDLLVRFAESDHLKQDILELSSKSTIKPTTIRNLVEIILDEWNCLNNRIHFKIAKLEKFKDKLNDLDLRLNRLREEIVTMENYLEHDLFKSFALDQFNFDQQILNKKTELEHLADCLSKRNTQTRNLFRISLNANRNNLNGNRQNQLFILNLSERWNNLTKLIKEKLFFIENLWILFGDLNDQIENLNLVLNKTDTFYRNTLLTAAASITNNNNNNNHSNTNSSSHSNTTILKLINELYSTIQEDNKLIKYLNESYVYFARMANYFSLFQLVDKFKHKLLEVNSQWDKLHNEIAAKIKGTRKQQNLIQPNNYSLLNKDKICSWLNEINLLLTNFEYLSTRELQIRCNDFYELKKEVCEQSDRLLMNSEKYLIDENLKEILKEIMKRIVRLDSYLQQSVPSSKTISMATSIASAATIASNASLQSSTSNMSTYLAVPFNNHNTYQLSRPFGCPSKNYKHLQTLVR